MIPEKLRTLINYKTTEYGIKFQIGDRGIASLGFMAGAEFMYQEMEKKLKLAENAIAGANRIVDLLLPLLKEYKAACCDPTHPIYSIKENEVCGVCQKYIKVIGDE